MAGPNHISNSNTVPASTASPAGSWVNATANDSINIQAGILLVQFSTLNPATLVSIDSDMVPADVQNNINKQRTSVWNWVRPIAFGPSMTVVFHAAEGPSFQRFFVCAGTDGTLTDADAASLWEAAVKQFAVNNTSGNTTLIYVWTSQLYPIINTLPVDSIINQMINRDKTLNGPRPEIYSVTFDGKKNVRWPTALTTWQFISF
jgi:hypothetical protein